MDGYVIESILKQQFNNDVPSKFKLSALKEISIIFLMRFVSELANSLGIQIGTSLPVFSSFKPMKFMQQPEWVDAKTATIITAIQLDISSKSLDPSLKKVRGRFIVIF